MKSKGQTMIWLPAKDRDAIKNKAKKYGISVSKLMRIGAMCVTKEQMRDYYVTQFYERIDG